MYLQLQSSTASDDEVIYEPADPEASVLSDEKLFTEVLELFTRLNIAGTDSERAEVRPSKDQLGRGENQKWTSLSID